MPVFSHYLYWANSFNFSLHQLTRWSRPSQYVVKGAIKRPQSEANYLFRNIADAIGYHCCPRQRVAYYVKNITVMNTSILTYHNIRHKMEKNKQIFQLPSCLFGLFIYLIIAYLTKLSATRIFTQSVLPVSNKLALWSRILR